MIRAFRIEFLKVRTILCLGMVLMTTISFSQEKYAVVSVNIIPMTENVVLENQTVLISGGRIEKIEPSNSLSIPPSYEVIDGRGKYLLPGFINMYTHVNESNLILYLANGQTTVRDLPSHINVLGLREEVKNGRTIGPNILAYGLRATGAPAPFHTQQPIFTPQQGIEQVREAKRLGYDGMFIYATCDPKTYYAILDEAEKLNFPISGHFPLFIAEDLVLRGKQMEFDNLTGLTSRGKLRIEKNKLIAALDKHKKAITPSLVVHHLWSKTEKQDSLFEHPFMDYVPPKLKATWKPDNNNSSSTYPYQEVASLIKELSDRGIQLFLGSDGGYPLVVPGFAFLEEMALFAKAGIDNYKILQYATADAAGFLHLEEKGTLEEAKVADMVLLDGNPLQDINNTRNIAGTFINGKWLSKAYFEKALIELKKENLAKQDRFGQWQHFFPDSGKLKKLSYTFYSNDYEIGEQKITIDTMEDRKLGITSVMIMDSPDYRETYSYHLVNRGQMDSLFILNKGSEGETRAALARRGDSIYISGYSPFHGDFQYQVFAPPQSQLWAPFTSRYYDMENVMSYFTALQFGTKLAVDESNQFSVYQIELNSEEFGDRYILDESTTTLYRKDENEYRIFYPGFSGYPNRTRLPFTIKIKTNTEKIPLEISDGKQVIKIKNH